ncbi:MAG: phosphatase PAP2 family protein [Bacteroidia bacterium]|nr:phosphatase PAP2 family protein [Bacteroidia bacterium]
MNFRKQGLAMVIAVVLTAGASDYISSRVVKNNVQRIRPCNDNNVKYQMILRVPCGSGYSFTSSHATNHFAVASILVMLLSRIWGWVRWPLYLWAASIAFAQVYVGVHYPLDVIFGALLGFGIAKFVYFLFRKTNFSLGEIVY